VIDTNEKLAAFLPVLKSAPWLALDTEADSLHAYPEKVCLIQVSTAEGESLVDPLAPIDINPFLDSLVGRELIFHALDTNTMVQALAEGHPFHSILDAWVAGQITWAVSTEVMLEYEEVLTRMNGPARWRKLARLMDLAE
jgi:ribonuclease D